MFIVDFDVRACDLVGCCDLLGGYFLLGGCDLFRGFLLLGQVEDMFEQPGEDPSARGRWIGLQLADIPHHAVGLAGTRLPVCEYTAVIALGKKGGTYRLASTASAPIIW